MKTERITFISVFTAFAMVLSYVEMLLPPFFSAVPAIKVGLPNIIIVFLLYKVSFKVAATVSLLRVLLLSMLFSNVMIFGLRISGAILSLLVMVILKKINIFSVVGVSVAGAVAHNLGQIIAAILILQTQKIEYYMIVLAVTGIIAGIFVGIAGAMCIKYSKKIRF